MARKALIRSKAINRLLLLERCRANRIVNYYLTSKDLNVMEDFNHLSVL